MNTITQYKPLALVFYIDGNGERSALPLDDSRREEFKRTIETHKMVELEGIIINTFDIKEIRPATVITNIEKFYYSQPPKIRAFIKSRAARMSGNSKTNPIEYFTSSFANEEKAIDRMTSIVENYLSQTNN